MLTNFDLEEMCDAYKVPLRGIYMKNQLPDRIQDGNYIINLQSSHQGNGTHWTGLTVYGNQTVFYDPFGAVPSMKIRKFVKTRPKSHLGFNNWIIQDLKSENCGYYVLSFFIFLQQHGVNARNVYEISNAYFNLFEDDTKRNDGRLRQFYKQTKGKHHPLIQRLTD